MDYGDERRIQTGENDANDAETESSVDDGRPRWFVSRGFDSVARRSMCIRNRNIEPRCMVGGAFTRRNDL